MRALMADGISNYVEQTCGLQRWSMEQTIKFCALALYPYFTRKKALAQGARGTAAGNVILQGVTGTGKSSFASATAPLDRVRHARGGQGGRLRAHHRGAAEARPEDARCSVVLLDEAVRRTAPRARSRSTARR